MSTVEDLAALLQRIAYDPPKAYPGSHGIELVDIRLPDAPEGLDGHLGAAYEKGVVIELDLSLLGLANPGAMEFRELDGLLGAPSSILIFEGLMGRRNVILDYARIGLLIRFADEDLEYGDICLPSGQLTIPPVIVLYHQSVRAWILDTYGLDAGDWAKRKGITTEELWQQLQDPTRCIPLGRSAPSQFHVAPAMDGRAAYESGSARSLNRIMSPDHTLSLNENEPLLWGSGWCARTQEVLDQNYTVMGTRLLVNEYQIDPDYYASRDYGSTDPNAPTFCRSFYVLVDSWPEGTTCLEVRHAILEPLSDGWQDYPRGSLSSYFCVMVDLQ